MNHTARWRRTVATVGLAALPACATLTIPRSAVPTVASEDAVVAAPGCLPGTERIGYDLAGFVLAGAFLGALVAGPKASGQAMKRDMIGGVLLGTVLYTWLTAPAIVPSSKTPSLISAVASPRRALDTNETSNSGGHTEPFWCALSVPRSIAPMDSRKSSNAQEAPCRSHHHRRRVDRCLPDSRPDAPAVPRHLAHLADVDRRDRRRSGGGDARREVLSRRDISEVYRTQSASLSGITRQRKLAGSVQPSGSRIAALSAVRKVSFTASVGMWRRISSR